MRQNYCICGQLVDSDTERNEHILSHFEQKHCNSCAYDLIFVAGKWYQPHNDINCNVIKDEPDYDDAVMNEDCNLLTIVEQNVKDESIELLTSMGNLANIDDPLNGIDPIEQITVPESNMLDDDLFESSEIEMAFTEEQPELSHQTQHASEAQLKKYPCKVCSMSFTQRQNRYTHMKKNHPDYAEPFKHVVNRITGEPIRKRGRPPVSSVKTNHQGPGATVFPCKFCPVVFSRRQNRHAHMKAIHAECTLPNDETAEYEATSELSTIQTRSRSGISRAVKTNDLFAELTSSDSEMEEQVIGIDEDYSEHDTYDSLDRDYRPGAKRRASNILDWSETSASNSQGFEEIDEQTNDSNYEIEHEEDTIGDTMSDVAFIDDENSNPSNAEVSSDEHRESRQGEGMWKCGICLRLYSQNYDLYEHLRVKHESEDKSLAIPVPSGNTKHDSDILLWRCGICSLLSTKKHNLYKHLRDKHESDDKTLAIPAPNTMKERVGDIKMWKCAFCSALSTQKHNMYKHLRILHGSDDKSMAVPAPHATKGCTSTVKLWSCGFCAKTAVHKHNLYKHMREVHGSDDKTMAKPATKIEERKMPDPVKMWSCGFCVYKSPFKGNVYKHLRTMHDCDDKTMAKPMLDWDESNDNSSSSFVTEKNHPRTMQTKQSETNDSSHFEVERNETELELSICASSVGNSSPVEQQNESGDEIEFEEKMVSHVPINTDEFDEESCKTAANQSLLWECRLCCTRSTFKLNMYKHLRKVHATGDKSLIISVASNRHKRKGRAPWRVGVVLPGSNSKTYPCKYCPSTYTCRQNRHTHEKTVHGAKEMGDETTLKSRRGRPRQAVLLPGSDSPVYECKFCPTVFTCRQNRYMHERNKHATLPKENGEAAYVVTKQQRNESRVGIILPGSDSKVYACKYCPKVFTLRQNRYSHERRMHTERNEGNDDSNTTTRPRRTAWRLGIIQPKTGSKVYTCELCPAVFTFRQNRYKHMLNIHKKRSEKNEDESNGGTISDISRSPSIASATNQDFIDQYSASERFSDDFNEDYCDELTDIDSSNLFRPADENIPTTSQSTEIPDDNVKMWSCGQCSRMSAVKTNMLKHIQSAHDSNDETLAKPILDWEDSMELHPINDTDPVECRLCSKILLNSTMLSRHMRLMHKISHDGDAVDSLSCNYCSEDFSDKGSLDVHKRSLHLDRLDEDKIIKCTKCPALFERYDLRRIHLIREHNVDEKFYRREFKCMVCELAFKFPGALIGHLAEHDPLDEYKCCIESCADSFKTINDLHTHLRNHRVPEEEKRECDKCNRTFTEWGFHVHKCVPPGSEKLYICDLCGKQFTILYSFKLHMNRHTGTKLYKCLYCPSTFASPGSRLTHQRTHTGEKPCKCNIANCGRAFIQHTDLYRHQYKAHGIFRKKFPCSVCQEVFPENPLLRKHMLAIHGIATA